MRTFRINLHLQNAARLANANTFFYASQSTKPINIKTQNGHSTQIHTQHPIDCNHTMCLLHKVFVMICTLLSFSCTVLKLIFLFYCSKGCFKSTRKWVQIVAKNNQIRCRLRVLCDPWDGSMIQRSSSAATINMILIRCANSKIIKPANEWWIATNRVNEEHFRWLELKSACCPGHILSLVCMLCMRPVNKWGKYNFYSQFDFIDFGFQCYPCCSSPSTLRWPHWQTYACEHKSVAGKFLLSFVNLSIKFDIYE